MIIYDKIYSVVITSDSLLLFSSAVVLCKTVKSIINFNILFSVGIKIAAIFLAILGNN
jgi:cation transport ATPase